MKKNEKIVIGILILIVIMFIAVILIWRPNYNLNNNVSLDIGIGIDKDEISEKGEIKEEQKIIKVNGTLYYNTGEKSTALRCGIMDGKITSNVKLEEIPTKDNESNFEGEYGYQYGNDNTIEVNIDGDWYIFATLEYETERKDEFELRVYDKQPQTDTKIHKILDKSETDKYDYNIYSYDLSVNIIINGEELSLRNALLENKITMDEIIAKQGCLRNVCYDDGGSTEYYNKDYTLIKLNKLDGNRDVYIGTKELNLNALEID